MALVEEAVVVAEGEGGEETAGMGFVVRESIDNLEWMKVYEKGCPNCQFSSQNLMPEQYRPVDVHMDCSSLRMVVGSFQYPMPYRRDLLHVE